VLKFFVSSIGKIIAKGNDSIEIETQDGENCWKEVLKSK
jgi:hypothetical protein